MAVGDPAATRTVYTTVVLLVVLGIGLAALAVWIHRRTRPEPELLAPLEEMDSRRWRSRDPATRGRLLDEARPAGARPLRRAASAPDVDDDFAATPPVGGFDDLAAERVPSHHAPRPEAPPASAAADGHEATDRDATVGGATGRDAPADGAPADDSPADEEPTDGGDEMPDPAPAPGPEGGDEMPDAATSGERRSG